MRYNNNIIVRVLGRRGSYPRFPLVLDNHILVADDSIVWSAVRQPPINEDGWGTEVNWLHPEEIRFFASLSLIEPFPNTHGFYLAEPWTDGEWLSDTGGPLSSPEFLDLARTSALGQLAAAQQSDYLLTQPHRDYYFRERGTAEEVLEILNNIDPADDLLLRGLSKFQSSANLIRLAPYMEEAAVSAFVSREAAFLMLKEHLEVMSGKRASLKDVTDHIREVFPTGQPFSDVLESDYEARLMFVHPVTDFGAYWCPPVFAEECYDAVKTLIHLYRYILLGEVWTPTDNEE